MEAFNERMTAAGWESQGPPTRTRTTTTSSTRDDEVFAECLDEARPILVSKTSTPTSSPVRSPPAPPTSSSYAPATDASGDHRRVLPRRRPRRRRRRSPPRSTTPTSPRSPSTSRCWVPRTPGDCMRQGIEAEMEAESEDSDVPGRVRRQRVERSRSRHRRPQCGARLRAVDGVHRADHRATPRSCSPRSGNDFVGVAYVVAGDSVSGLRPTRRAADDRRLARRLTPRRREGPPARRWAPLASPFAGRARMRLARRRSVVRVCRRHRGRRAAAPATTRSRLATAALQPPSVPGIWSRRAGRSPRPTIVLARDGLGIAAFGDGADDTIAAVTAVLGEPDKDSGWVEPLSIGACAGEQGSLRGLGLAVPLLLRPSRRSADGERALLRLLVRERERSRSDSRGPRHPRRDRPRHDRRVPPGGLPRRRHRAGEEGLFPSNFYVDDTLSGRLTGGDDDDLVTVIIGGDPCGVSM